MKTNFLQEEKSEWLLKDAAVKVLILLLFISNIALLMAYNPAYAGEGLFFNAKERVSGVTLGYIDSYLIEQNFGQISDYDIAVKDLNRDGLNEYVLKSKHCPELENGCTYIILAQNNLRKTFILMNVNAKKLLLGNSFTNGIQDFLVFPDNNNDYEYERYIWSPTEAQYILKKTH